MMNSSGTFQICPSAALRWTCARGQLSSHQLHCCLCHIHQKLITQCLKESFAVIKIEVVCIHTVYICIKNMYICLCSCSCLYVKTESSIRQDKIALWLWDTGKLFPLAPCLDPLVPRGGIWKLFL